MLPPSSKKGVDPFLVSTQGFIDITNKPLLTVLNFSGGKQSSALLWMFLKKDLPLPENFVVLNADPGMENSGTYAYVKLMKSECEKAGIRFITVEGPNLYQDLINLKSTSKTRLDNPPYWTLSEKGKVGRLQQGCTKFYKIAPMDRQIRKELFALHGISIKSKRIPENSVHKLIGFSFDEQHRIKNPQAKYTAFRFPLVEMGFTNSDVLAYFALNKLPIPPRSVCNACFANGLDTHKECFTNRPGDWAQTVAVDEVIRDLSQIAVKDRVFVSKTCIPLTQLAAQGFSLGSKEDDDEYACTSGYCFT